MLILLLLLTTLSFGIGIEEAMRTALEKNLEIKALEEELKVFEGMKRSATKFPNPEVRLESGFITTDKDGKPVGRAFYLLEYSQPIPLWNIRKKSGKVIEEERESFLNLVEARRRKILGEVYRRFHDALFRKELVRIWEENLRTAQEVEEFVKRAYDLGEVTELELLRARRERNMAEVQLSIAKAEYRASLKELSKLLNTDVRDVEGNFTVTLKLRNISFKEIPAIKALEKKISALQKQIELEKALAKPSVKAGFVIEDSGEGYYGLRAALSFELPVFYRRQGEIIQRIAQKKAIKRRLEAEMTRLKNKLSSIRIRLSTLNEELKRLDNEVIPRAEEELKLALRSYRLRVISLLELSDVRRRYYELLIKRAELLKNLHSVYGEFIAIGGWR